MCFFSAKQLESGKISLSRSQFIVNIARLVPGYGQSTKWSTFLSMLEEYEDGNQAIVSLSKVQELGIAINAWKKKDISKKARIYKILDVAFDVINNYLSLHNTTSSVEKVELVCGICYQEFKDLQVEDSTGNYLMKLPCKQTCCFDCLLRHYVPHDQNNVKGDGYNKCPWCRKELKKELISLFLKSSRYKELYEKHMQEKEKEKIEQEENDFLEAERLYLEELQALEEAENELFGLPDYHDENEEDEEDEEEEASDDGYESQEF